MLPTLAPETLELCERQHLDQTQCPQHSALPCRAIVSQRILAPAFLVSPNPCVLRSCPRTHAPAAMWPRAFESGTLSYVQLCSVGPHVQRSHGALLHRESRLWLLLLLWYPTPAHYCQQSVLSMSSLCRFVSFQFPGPAWSKTSVYCASAHSASKATTCNAGAPAHKRPPPGPGVYRKRGFHLSVMKASASRARWPQDTEVTTSQGSRRSPLQLGVHRRVRYPPHGD